LISDQVDVDKDGNALTYGDIIYEEDTISDDIFTKISFNKAVQIINEKLSSRERTIIIHRYGIDGKPPLTQKDVAVKLGISRSYVSRIEKSALGKIKEEL